MENSNTDIDKNIQELERSILMKLSTEVSPKLGIMLPVHIRRIWSDHFIESAMIFGLGAGGIIGIIL